MSDFMGRWVTVNVDAPRDLRAGLRAAIDDDGCIWVWAGLIADRAIVLVLAAFDDEPLLLNGGAEYIRLPWMRKNIAPAFDNGAEVLDAITRRVASVAYQ